MKEEKTSSGQFVDLRRQAEEMLRQLPEEVAELAPEDVQRLIHELRVHQIELEMQNDELRRVQGELETSHEKYFDLYDLAPVGYITLSEKDLILDANLTVATMLGVERGSLIKQPFTRFIASENQDIYYLHRKKLFETQKPQVSEMRVVRKDGSQFWVRIEATVALDSEGQVVYRTSVSDVSEHKRMEEALHALLLIDELTGLYNRRGFLTLSQQQLKMANRTKNKMLLFYADFDHLKQINDALGHPEGDRALIEAANVLKETFRASDIIARIGGDEFAVLVIDTDRTEAEILTNRLHENLKARNDERNRRFKLLLSIGIARYDPEFPCSIDELIATADKMMYERKQDDQRS